MPRAAYMFHRDTYERDIYFAPRAAFRFGFCHLLLILATFDDFLYFIIGPI